VTDANINVSPTFGDKPAGRLMLQQ
jgi:hypothetical protein